MTADKYLAKACRFETGGSYRSPVIRRRNKSSANCAVNVRIRWRSPRNCRCTESDAGGIGEPDVHRALGNVLGAGLGSGRSGDRKRVGGSGAAARAERHRLGGLLADRAMLGEGLRAHAEQLHLHRVVVGDEAAHEVLRTARRRW